MAHKIHLYTHSFNFFSHCLLFLFLFSRSMRSLFSAWLFYASCNFVCTITFNSLLFRFFFSFISFSRPIQISFCYLSFCPVLLLSFPLPEPSLLLFLSVAFSISILFSLSLSLSVHRSFPIRNRKMFAHFSFLAYHLKMEQKMENANRSNKNPRLYKCYETICLLQEIEGT